MSKVLYAARDGFSFICHIKITKNTDSADLEKETNAMDIANCEEVA